MSIDIKKINEDFALSTQTNDFAINFKWRDSYPALWDLIQGACDDIYAEIYEKVANYVQNTRDVEFCNMHSLNSLLHEMGQENIFAYDLVFPPDLERLMNVLSVGKNYMPEVNRHLLSASVESLCAFYMDSTAIGAFSGWNLFGANGSTSMFDSTLSAFNFLSGTTTVTKNWANATQTSAEISNDIILTDTSYLMRPTNDDFVSDQLYQHLYNKTRNFDILEVCGVIIPTNLSEEAILARLSYKQEAIYEQWKEANKYVGFLDDIWPEADPYKNISYTSTTSAQLIASAVDILKDICVKTSYIRETLKKVTRKYAMIGTAQSVQKNIDELIKRSFTKQTELSNWRYAKLNPTKYKYTGNTGSNEVYSTTKDVSSQALIETFSPLLSSITNLIVDIVEHNDTTEYMNIKAMTPTVTSVLSFTTTYATSSWIDSNGTYQSTVVPVAIPVATDTGAPSMQGGNPQYWQPANVNFAKSNSAYSTGDMHDYYSSVGFTAAQLSAVDDWLINGSIDNYSSVSGLFLPTIWSTFATSGYSGYATMQDLSGIPAPEYVGVDPTLIPADGWIIPPVDISVLQSKYIGTSAGDYPAMNIKNQQFPTVATQQFVWNLVEKSFALTPTINTSPLWSTINDVSADLRDSNGHITNSWKFNAHEFHGYNTFYENSLNLNYKQVEDARIDVDGPYKEDLLTSLSGILSTGINSTNVNTLSGHYSQLARYDLQFENTGGKFENLDKIKSQLLNWMPNIISLSGQSPFENKNILNASNYSGNIPVAFDADVYDNQYTLFKKDTVAYETPGILWMRYRSHPVAFPAMSGVIQGITSINSALSILNAFYFNSIDVGGCVVTADEDNGTFCRYAISRPDSVDGYEIASWYPATYNSSPCTANPYLNTLVIYDYMLMNLSVPYAINGMQTMFDNCYDFFIDGDKFVVIGKALDKSTWNDKVVVFSVAPKTITTMISGDGATDDIVEVIANSTNSPQFINLGAAGAGILRYVGHYYTKDRINFISVNGVPTATELKLDINSYNRNTNVFETTSLITITETNFNIAPQVGQGYQFALAESANLISIGYMVDESTIVTIDFNKNEINNTNYLVSKWSV